MREPQRVDVEPPVAASRSERQPGRELGEVDLAAQHRRGHGLGGDLSVRDQGEVVPPVGGEAVEHLLPEVGSVGARGTHR